MKRNAFRSLLAFFLVALGFSAAAQQLPFDFRQFDRLEEALELTPPQKEQYDIAVGATKRMLFHVAMAALQMKERLRDELAKPRPDLNILYELKDRIVEDGKPLRNEARDEWRKLYAMLSDDQVATLKRFIEDKLDPVGSLHDFMSQLLRK